VQSFEMEIEKDTFIGMPFVLLSNGRWIKNNGSDFYIEFGRGSKHVQKVATNISFTLLFIIFFFIFTNWIFSTKDAGDGIGTARALLDKIAKMESEAQKSFMHRSVKCLCIHIFSC
jgi:alpha-glucan,water dikinase